MEILCMSYTRVKMLKDWLHDQTDDGIFELGNMETDSSQSLKQLLESVYVCEMSEKCLVPILSLSCHCEQKELVLTAIERALSKNRHCNNLITYGFSLMSPDQFSQRCGVNIENRYPNSCVNRLYYPAWEHLLSRIGDTYMTYLLEHTSLYIYNTAGSLVQLTGTPLHNLLQHEKDQNKKKFKKNIKKVDKPHTKQRYDNMYSNTTINMAENVAESIDLQTNAAASIDVSTGVTNKSKEILDNMDRQCLGNKQKLDHQNSERKHMIVSQSKNNAIRNLNATSSSKTIKDSYKPLPKKKRKYEEINQQRFLDFKRDCALYIIRNRQDTDHHSTDHFDDLSLGNEDGQTGNTCGRLTLNSRKRKISEDRCSDTESDKHIVERCKRLCVERLKYMHDDVENIEFCMEESDTTGMLSKSCINVKKRKVRNRKDLSKNKQRISKNKKKGLESSQERNLDKNLDCSFCPFSYHLPLKRNNALFIRNPREKLSKSVLSVLSSQAMETQKLAAHKRWSLITVMLSKLRSSSGDALLLCRDIFCDTKVFTRNELQVILPDIDEIRKEFCDFKKCYKPSDCIGSNLNKENSSQQTVFSGGKIDVPCNTEQTVMLEHVEDCQPATNRSCINHINKQSVNEKVEKNLSGIATANIPDICRPVFESPPGDISLNENIDNNCEKVLQLTRRKFEILRNKKAQNSKKSELETVESNENACSYLNICNKDVVDPDISVHDSSSESVIPEVGNDDGCCVERVTKVRQCERSSSYCQAVSNSAYDTCCNCSSNKDRFVLQSGSESSEVVQEINETDGKINASSCSIEEQQDHDNLETEADNSDDILTIDVSIVSSVVAILKQFINNHRVCPYKALLNYHCPAVVYKKKASSASSRTRQGFRRGSRKVSTFNLLSNHHHPRKIYLFLRACILKVLPVEMIGTKHNLNVLLKNLSKMVSLGKNDKLTLGQLMNGMKTSEVEWLRSNTSNSVKLHLLARMVQWLFNYLLTLTKTYFFITDTAFLRYKIVYYRQVTWNKLHVHGFSDLIQRKIFKIVSQKKVSDALQTRASLGVSVLRFLPKQQSLRPIINMGSSVTVESHQTRPVNKQISDLHCILTYIKNRNPSLIGHGIMGTYDVYKSWIEFIGKWRSYGCPELYFVKTDISKCFDSIRQSKLYAVMERILTKEMNDEDYIIRKYFICGVKDGNLFTKYKREVNPLSEFNPDFTSFSADKARQDRTRNIVFVDKVIYQHETSETLLKALKIHIFNNFIKVGNHYCLQTSGISQGSVISTLLCSFYYADMEKNLFKISDGDFILRLVDDYLYITPSKHKAINFLNTMISGIPEYSCSTNKEKISTNFRWDGDGEWFSWCGMFFNTRTLEVGLDFTKYSGFSIKDTVSVDQSNSAGISLKEKMIFCIKQTCHRLFIDLSVNSNRQVLKNVYQIFLLAVFKLHTHMTNLPFNKGASKNSMFFFGVITEMIKVVRKCVGKYQKYTERCVSNSSYTVTWLCLKACTLKLSRHHAQYKALLKHVNKQLYHIQEYLTCQELEELEVVVKPGMPVDFQNILP